MQPNLALQGCSRKSLNSASGPTTLPGAPMRGEPKCGTNTIIRFGNTALSTVAAALPVVTLLVLIASGKVKAHLAAIIALVVANIGVMGKMIDAQSIVVASPKNPRGPPRGFFGGAVFVLRPV
jgi:hypothetical protein